MGSSVLRAARLQRESAWTATKWGLWTWTAEKPENEDSDLGLRKRKRFKGAILKLPHFGVVNPT